MDMVGPERKCYPAIKHKIDGDIIHVRDCVLVKSGPKKSDVPYIAKISALWESDGGKFSTTLFFLLHNYIRVFSGFIKCLKKCN